MKPLERKSDEVDVSSPFNNGEGAGLVMKKRTGHSLVVLSLRMSPMRAEKRWNGGIQ